jgi:soluble calcium-activated nucleotidase 1
LQHNEAGRGAELSELVLYNRKLLTFDDRTGIMFEVANFEDSGVGAPGSKAREADKPALIPRQLFMEGDGATDKGMKIEWATLKDGLLWIGSFGKEYTDSAGNILHANNLWVKVMSEKGVIQVRRSGRSTPGRWARASIGRHGRSLQLQLLPCLASRGGMCTLQHWC